MKKLILINLFAVAVFCVAFSYTKSNKPVCSNHCCSHIKETKPTKDINMGGGESEEQLFRYNRLFIKI